MSDGWLKAAECRICHFSGAILYSRPGGKMVHRFLILLLILLCTTQVYAEEGELRVAVVNMQKVLNDSVTGKSARKKLENEVSQRQAGLNKVGNEVKRLQEELGKQAGLLSAEALQDRKKQFQIKQRDLARQYQDEEEALVRRRAATLQDLVDAINEIVKEIAAKEGYQFVLDLDGRLVIFSSLRIDLTQRVITELDRR